MTSVSLFRKGSGERGGGDVGVFEGMGKSGFIGFWTFYSGYVLRIKRF